MHKRRKQSIKQVKKFEPKIQQYSLVLTGEDGNEVITYYEVEKPENYFNWSQRNGFKLYGSKDLVNKPQFKSLYTSLIPAEIMAKVFIGDMKGNISFEVDNNGLTIAKELSVENIEKLNPEGYMYLVSNSDLPTIIIKYYLKDFKYKLEEIVTPLNEL